MRIVLGSKSPRRSEILSSLGYSFTVRISDEDEIVDEKLPKEIVKAIAKQKADNIKIDDDELLITADTIVTIDNFVLGKPKDEEDAFRMLSLLSGRTHQVITAVCFKYQDKFFEFLEESNVTVKKIGKREIDEYIKTKDPMDKAGAYGIQSGFGKYIEKYDGDYYTIMGLPKERLKKELDRFIKTLH